MRKLKFGRPSPAMVIAMIALIATLGGVGYAAKKKKKKFKLKNGAVTTKKIKNNAVTEPKIADGAVATLKLAPGERSGGFFSKQDAATPLPAATDTTVATLSLPAGANYQVTAQTSLSGDAATNNPVECSLKDDGATLTAASAFTNLAATYQDSVSLTWFADGGSVTLSCNPTIASQARNRVLAATRVNSVTQP